MSRSYLWQLVMWSKCTMCNFWQRGFMRMQVRIPYTYWCTWWMWWVIFVLKIFVYSCSHSVFENCLWKIAYKNHFQWIARGTHTAVMGRLVTTTYVLVLKIQSAQTLRDVKMGNAKKQVVTPYHVVQMQPVKCLTMILHVNVILDTTLLPHQRMVVVS